MKKRFKTLIQVMAKIMLAHKWLTGGHLLRTLILISKFKKDYTKAIIKTPNFTAWQATSKMLHNKIYELTTKYDSHLPVSNIKSKYIQYVCFQIQ